MNDSRSEANALKQADGDLQTDVNALEPSLSAATTANGDLQKQLDSSRHGAEALEQKLAINKKTKQPYSALMAFANPDDPCFVKKWRRALYRKVNSPTRPPDPMYRRDPDTIGGGGGRRGFGSAASMLGHRRKIQSVESIADKKLEKATRLFSWMYGNSSPSGYLGKKQQQQESSSSCQTMLQRY